jgi:hypothetical protein
MMLGSLLYKYIMTHFSHITPTRLLVTTLSIAAASFFIPVLWRDERVTMWCFCIFEICCGVYFPLMAYQKGKIVEDGVRANVYGLMRIPLNVFVVLVLSTTKEGQYGCDSVCNILTDAGVRHRDLVFTSCSALLLAAVAVNGTLL